MEKRAGLDLEKVENIPTSRTIAPSLGGQLWGARLPWEVLYSDSALPASREAKGPRRSVRGAKQEVGPQLSMGPLKSQK